MAIQLLLSRSVGRIFFSVFFIFLVSNRSRVFDSFASESASVVIQCKVLVEKKPQTQTCFFTSNMVPIKSQLMTFLTHIQEINPMILHQLICYQIKESKEETSEKQGTFLWFQQYSRHKRDESFP